MVVEHGTEPASKFPIIYESNPLAGALLYETSVSHCECIETPSHHRRRFDIMKNDTLDNLRRLY